MTADASDTLPLGGEFPTPTIEQWRALVDGVLKGAPFERKLVTRTYDGLSIQPLYTAATAPADAGLPGAAPFVRGVRVAGNVDGGWDVRQLHADPDPAALNDAVLTDLERGVTSLWLRVGAGGVPVSGLGRALEGVLLDLAPVVLDAGADLGAAAEALLALWDDRGVLPSEARGNLGADPLGRLARTGVLEVPLDAALAEVVSLAARVVTAYPGVRTVVADGTVAHDAGASDAEELAFVLAAGVAYLRALTAGGLSLGQALGQIELRVAATADQFTTIAKVRAVRRVWARVAEASGASASAGSARVHAVTSAAMLTQRDPWVNLLRTSIACFAAGVAGADSITVLPFDAAIGRPDAFARRVARNTHALLLEESNLARVIDPGGGSWYVESLSEELAAAAWSRFQQIEGEGGLVASLTSGALQERIAATAAARDSDIATRRFPLTGVSEFPDLGQVTLEREPWPAPPVPSAPAVTVRALAPRRYAAAYEALRDRADAHRERSGSRPVVFLANLGPVAVHTARATFAKAFFEAGGIEALGNDGLTGPDEAAAAFAASGASQVVICSSDAVYAESAEATARALKAAGAGRVYLAGNPGDRRAGYEAAGIDEFVFIGSNVVQILTTALDAMGVGSTTDATEVVK